MDTKENELVQKLTSQITEKDSIIRKLQGQLEEMQRQRLNRLQGVANSEGKGGSAGPNAKTELSKVKKQLREKDKEINKLRTENA